LNMKRTLTLIIATVAAATLVASSFGQGAGPGSRPGQGSLGAGGQKGQGGRGGKMGNMDSPILEKLNLTDDQKKNIKALKEKMAKSVKDLREKGQGGDRTAMRESYKKLMKDYQTGLEKLLTPSQWTDYQKAMKEMRSKMGGRGGAGAPGAPGEKRKGGKGGI